MKFSKKRLAVLAGVALVATAIAVPVALAGYWATNGTLSHYDKPLVHYRLFRDSVPSTCAGKANPGLFGTPFTDRRVYDRYRFTNPSSSSQCVQVWIHNGCGVNLHGQANSSFVASNPSANYLGDAGSSLDDQAFGFPIGGGQSFDVVLGEVFGGVTSCPYRVIVHIGNVVQTATSTTGSSPGAQD